MSEILHFKALPTYINCLIWNSQHPLVAVLDFSQVSEQVNQN
jgi:hypothetical protein